MRILFCEWKKLFSFQVLWILMICLFLVNGYIQISVMRERSYSAESYRAIHEKMSKMSLDEADDFVSGQIDSVFSGKTSEYSMELLMDIQEHITLLNAYPEYLFDINAQKKSMSVISIWGGKDTFSYRNIQKTPQAYEALSETVLLLAPMLGIKDALQNPLTDFIGLSLIFLLVTTVMLKDREQCMMPLLYSMPNGRERLFFEKLALITLSTIGIVFLLYGENFIISGTMYGVGDLSRPVQCIDILYSCNLSISVGIYLALFFLMKILAFLVYAVMFVFACVVSKNNLMLYSISGCYCGFCYLLHHFVPENSVFGLLHYINPVQFIYVNDVIGTYCNINFFGYPVSLKIVSFITILFMLIVTISLCSVLFVKNKNMQYRNIVPHLFKKKHVHGQFYYVCYRSLVLQKGFILIMVLLFLAYLFSANFSRVYTSDDIYYEKFTTQFQGAITQETYDFITEKELHYSVLENRILELQMKDINQYEIAELYEKMRDKNALTRLKNRVDAIQHSSQNGELFYDSGYERLFGIGGNQETMYIILFEMLFLVMLLSPYASQDQKTNMIRVLYATSAGKTGYWKNLLLYSAICGVAVSILFNVPYVWNILQKYGMQGLSAPIQSITAFTQWNINITVSETIGLLLTLRIIRSCIIAMLISIFSAISRSQITAYVVNFSIFVLPVVLVLMW